MITIADATEQVERGFAEWLITSSYTSPLKLVCHICQNTEAKKSCQNCGRTGEVEKEIRVNIFGTDIVLVAAGSITADGSLTFRSVLSKKTPRVATIEKAHIIRAYVNGNKDEQERIEAYGLMTLETRIAMPIGVEPPDDPSTGTGRNCDWGRSPFAKISDERTSLGLGRIGGRIDEGYKQLEDGLEEK